MANDYCTIAQFQMIYDSRVMDELSNDTDSTVGNDTNIQFLLDLAASELDSILSGRYTLPLTTVDLVLTKFVAVKAVERMYARRNDLPEAVKQDIEWANQWIQDLKDRKINLPNVTRANAPNLYSSNYKDGRSQFDHVPFLDKPPTSTSTSKGN